MENQAVPVTPLASSNPSTSVTTKYAGFWIRFVAIMVDSLILSIPIALTQVIVAVALVSSGVNARGVSFIVYLIITWTYFVLMTYYNGRTLGKMLVGITIKSDNFGKLSFGKVLLRETVGKFVSQIILFIGFIIVGVTQKKQGLHDMFAHSIVVYKNPSNPNTVGLVVGIIIACILPIIAIIGILSSVVLVSLNVAREKGHDAQLQSVLSQLRTEAEVYYGNKNTYSVTRSCSSGMFVDPSFGPVFSELKDKNVVSCYAEGQTYAISAPLSTPDQSYCFDSTAFSGMGIAVDDGSKASCKTISSMVNKNNI